MTSRYFLSLLLIVMVSLSGCAGVAVVGGPPHEHPQAFEVPPGHLPPPGQCRVWYPDRPPGQQPPPGDCHALRYQVPSGAHLVRGK